MKGTVRKLLLMLCLMVGSVTLGFTQGVLFRYKYKSGDTYKILSTVDEAVYVNGQLDYNTQIINRVTVEVTRVNADGSGEHSAIFMTSENVQNSPSVRALTWGETYPSSYTCDVLGHYSITDDYFMPTVRDVPVFPERALAPGDKWDERGHEAHDLRPIFGIQKPFKVPFMAHYEYIGTVRDNTSAIERELEEIHINYTMSFDPPMPSPGTKVNDYPVRYTGFSQQKVFWDKNKGAIDHYSEVFKITMSTVRGNTMDFIGTAKAEVTDNKRTATKENVENVTEKIKDLGVKNVDVKATDKGLTLSIENIKFGADSAVLANSEKDKLKKLATILKAYPDNDLLVTGHTATGGSVETQQSLSEERAQTVADYLMSLGVKGNNNIFTKGLGATEPVAPNDTEANKSRNRRVEITILDK